MKKKDSINGIIIISVVTFVAVFFGLAFMMSALGKRSFTSALIFSASFWFACFLIVMAGVFIKKVYEDENDFWKGFVTAILFILFVIFIITKGKI